MIEKAGNQWTWGLKLTVLGQPDKVTLDVLYTLQGQSNLTVQTYGIYVVQVNIGDAAPNFKPTTYPPTAITGGKLATINGVNGVYTFILVNSAKIYPQLGTLVPALQWWADITLKGYGANGDFPGYGVYNITGSFGQYVTFKDRRVKFPNGTLVSSLLGDKFIDCPYQLPWYVPFPSAFIDQPWDTISSFDAPFANVPLYYQQLGGYALSLAAQYSFQLNVGAVTKDALASNQPPLLPSTKKALQTGRSTSTERSVCRMARWSTHRRPHTT